MTPDPDPDGRAQPWVLAIGLGGAALMLASAAAAARKRARPPRAAPDASLAAEHPAAGGAPRRPGDEAEAGSPQTGEGLCPTCSGQGAVGGRPCATCLGTGTVVVNVGDA